MPRIEADVTIDKVFGSFLSFPEAQDRFAQVIRATYDQIYDGVNTGRYRVEQLYKTEQTHIGSLIEINLQREFKFEDGDKLDYSIAGTEVDCKFSKTPGGWMIPQEAQEEICLLVTANDVTSRWSAGLVRPTNGILGAENRDRKRQLTATGRSAINWLWQDVDHPPNVLARLRDEVVSSIMAGSSGQRRINELCRRVQGQRIPRGTVATVAQQKDYMKRLRGNGGSRSVLQPEGIVILGQSEAHRTIARELGVAVPGRGESVSVRLAHGSPSDGVEIDGSWWRVAKSGDEVVAAPQLPR